MKDEPFPCPSLALAVAVPRPDLVPPLTGSSRRSSGAAVSPQSGSDTGEMSTDIAREESFRTALRNQKRRLSATEKKPVTAEFGPGTWDLGC